MMKGYDGTVYCSCITIQHQFVFKVLKIRFGWQLRQKIDEILK